MLKMLNKIIKIGDRVYVSISVMLLVVLIITVTVGITARYFFNFPFDWTEELVILLFIWISFLGAAVADARHKFVIVDFLVGKLSPLMRNLINIFADILTIVFLVMVIIGSIILLPQMLTHASVALNIPRTYYYIAVFASSLLIFLVHLESLVRRIGVLSGKGETEETV